MCLSSCPSNFTRNIYKERNWLLYTNKLIHISKNFQMHKVLLIISFDINNDWTRQ